MLVASVNVATTFNDQATLCIYTISSDVFGAKAADLGLVWTATTQDSPVSAAWQERVKCWSCSLSCVRHV